MIFIISISLNLIDLFPREWMWLLIWEEKHEEYYVYIFHFCQFYLFFFSYFQNRFYKSISRRAQLASSTNDL